MAVFVLLGILGGAGILMVVTLVRRGGGRRTDTAEGMLLEQEALRRARHDRVSFGSAAVHNSVPTASDSYHRGSGRP
ncbi:hypothetical protein OG259_06150 [Streptomyces sp. NBC_00250]|uniref:hypothetical protein n=1 Tax=Streptomyces sp. NBC_00250 TaxID=2903641 RepID=UPI002E2887E6|nr:hypothetical protein [Streptomyces sp. NBC_00250]